MTPPDCLASLARGATDLVGVLLQWQFMVTDKKVVEVAETMVFPPTHTHTHFSIKKQQPQQRDI